MNMVQQFDPAQVDYSQDLGTPGAESDVIVTVHNTFQCALDFL